ncbi:DUF1054 domain-containing protein [Neobacillus sp. PS3-40]|uniref:DUF1054 domain-containing protein n=1 Tax=Neobacillus sp. PS3-40 TaxID=3070679 RepID=UPI0027DFC27D|nr:DUF1054 domain-containing protein [Neobacillus sp. PS3-40]WML43562.1 DUF1054 domain-containing protein [Neobacillus sp. PS3-40]
MNFTGFSNDDFDVFSIDGLEARMEALKERIRPKLESLGHYYAPILATLTGDEIFAHVAKHARRTKNPPIDTWVAFANNHRGYKMLPHFQIGLWGTHLFIWFAVIYESPNKQEIGKRLESQIDQIYSEIPDDFVWSTDHTNPRAIPQSQLSKTELLSFFKNLQTTKKAEILCGYQIDRNIAVKMEPSVLLKKIDHVFNILIPLAKITNSL